MICTLDVFSTILFNTTSASFVWVLFNSIWWLSLTEERVQDWVVLLG